jgi:ParB/RepB/Spo0J family partition protein
MAATVQLLDTRLIQKNRANPRLVFRQDELDALADSIREQGVLVPLSVYRSNDKYTLLDGERRWRCAVTLGLNKVPAIVQEKPDPVTNIMMMFAIHNARRDWDPLPTAMKLEELEKRLSDPRGKPPTIRKLAAAASLSPGEVRRYKKILAIPSDIRQQLLQELEKPKSEQKITVDHAIEALDGTDQLAKRGIIDRRQAEKLCRTIIVKFKSEVLTSTVEPRKLVRIARAVERGEITKESVRDEIKKFEAQARRTVEDIYKALVEESEYAHQTYQAISRLIVRLQEIRERQIDVEDDFAAELRRLASEIDSLLSGISE